MRETTGDHDAHLKVLDAERLGKKIVGVEWADNRQDVTPDEVEEVKRLTAEAEERVDPNSLDHGTVVARIWMEDERVSRVEWDGRFTDSGADQSGGDR